MSAILPRKNIALHPDTHQAVSMIAKKNRRKITDQIAYWVATDPTK